jgi:hypothetical protein
MIRGYSDHAANERTFLAWVRTGIAIVVFGFVIEKFNLFLLMIADADAVKGRRAALERLSGPVGRYEGLALILVGLPLIVAATETSSLIAFQSGWTSFPIRGPRVGTASTQPKSSPFGRPSSSVWSSLVIRRPRCLA